MIARTNNNIIELFIYNIQKCILLNGSNIIRKKKNKYCHLLMIKKSLKYTNPINKYLKLIFDAKIEK